MAVRATLGILTAYFLLALAAAFVAGEAGYFLARLPLWFAGYLTLFGVAYLLGGAILWLVLALAGELRANGTGAGLRSMAVRLWRDLLDGRLSRALYIGLLFCLVCTVFTAYKPLVGAGGFGWDPFFAELDASLHAGRAPWEWLHAYGGIGYIGRFLDIVYKAFFLVVTLCVTIFAFFPVAEAVRQRFVLGLLVVLPLCGSLLAQVFASAGPVYYDKVSPAGDPFGELRARLAEINSATPLESIELQSTLWQGHETFALGAIGVSAFPSVHIAVLTLCALAAARLSIIFSVLLWVWTILTVIATVYLGWHYAIDAYASIVLVLVIWKLLSMVPLER